MGSRNRKPQIPPGDEIIGRELFRDSEFMRLSEEWVRRRIYGLSDQEARWLYERYLEAYKEMLPAFEGAYDFEGNPQLLQRAALIDQIQRQFDFLTDDVELHLENTLIESFRQGYAGRAWVMDNSTGEDVKVRFPLLPNEAIRALLLQPSDLFLDWHEELGLNRVDFLTKMRRSLTQSMILGESIQQAQKRLREALGIETDRRKGFKENFWKTLLIARTEILKASNQAAVAIYEQNRDILTGWEWVATRDERTCPICQQLDGKVFLFDEPDKGHRIRVNKKGNTRIVRQPPPSGSHPGCRCTAVPVLADDELMKEITGPWQSYADWAALNGIGAPDDGGLSDQRGSGAHGLNVTSG
jgi:SPP1 gp7 family putative phage head morphogenesis protein